MDDVWVWLSVAIALGGLIGTVLVVWWQRHDDHGDDPGDWQ